MKALKTRPLSLSDDVDEACFTFWERSSGPVIGDFRGIGSLNLWVVLVGDVTIGG